MLPGLTPYAVAIAAMHAEQQRIAAGAAREAVWLLESPAGFNSGLSSSDATAPAIAGRPDLSIEAPSGPRRAGDWTYHGPGVRAGIVMLDLAARRKDIAGYVEALHAWLADAVAGLGIAAARRPELEGAGLWVGDGKLAAIGLNLAHWTTGFGFALYVGPSMADMACLPAPCGVRGKSVTSLAAERRPAAAPAMADVDAALRAAFHDHFGPTSLAEPPAL